MLGPGLRCVPLVALEQTAEPFPAHYWTFRKAAVDDFLLAAGLNLDTCDATVEVTDSGGIVRAGGLADAQQGDRVRVTVTHNFQVLSGSIIPGFQGVKVLTSTCVFRHE